MADQLNSDDLREFLITLSNTIDRTVAGYHASYLVGFVVYESRLDEHTRVLVAALLLQCVQVIHHWRICLG